MPAKKKRPDGMTQTEYQHLKMKERNDAIKEAVFALKHMYALLTKNPDGVITALGEEAGVALNEIKTAYKKVKPYYGK